MKHNIMYDIAFTVIADTSDGSDLTAQQIREAVLRRLAIIDDSELMESIGFCDSFLIED